MTTPDQGLAAFGVTPVGGNGYLYDSVLGRIIGEGSVRAVRAKVAEWEPISPGRYRACTADQLDAGVLLDWQDHRRFPSGLMIARGQTVNRAAQWVIVQTQDADPKLIDKEVP